MMKEQKSSEELPFKIRTFDVVLGMIVAIAACDWFIQPHFDNATSYGSKMLSWAVVTVIFLLIAGVVILGLTYVRLKNNKSASKITLKLKAKPANKKRRK